MEAMMQERFLRVAEVIEVVAVSRTTIWRWCREGRFPRPRQLGPGVVGFLASEVDEWFQSRPAVDQSEAA